MAKSKNNYQHKPALLPNSSSRRRKRLKNHFFFQSEVVMHSLCNNKLKQTTSTFRQWKDT